MSLVREDAVRKIDRSGLSAAPGEAWEDMQQGLRHVLASLGLFKAKAALNQHVAAATRRWACKPVILSTVLASSHAALDVAANPAMPVIAAPTLS